MAKEMKYQTDIREIPGLRYRIQLWVFVDGFVTTAMQRHIWYPSRDNPIESVHTEEWIATPIKVPTIGMVEVSEFTA